MLIVGLAAVLCVLALTVSVRALRRCQAVVRSPPVENDELEQRLAEKERRLVLGLSRRTVLALGRASLFGGTGLGVWALTGGSTHYLDAGAAFGLGLVGWAGCGEVHRRLGSLADLQGGPRRRQGVDQSERTG